MAYRWQGNMKVSLIVGVRRFGETYYLGVGFAHNEAPRGDGPGCATCNQDFNYPCSWHNVLSLVGHLQTLLLMAKGTTEAKISLSEALFKITYPPHPNDSNPHVPSRPRASPNHHHASP